MKTWKVTINFGGFIGCDNEYTVDDAETREEAIEEALEMARDDIEVIDVEEDEDWEDWED